jgi:Peptidase M15
MEFAMSKLISIPGISNPVEIDSPIYVGSNFTWGEATKDGTRIPVDRSISDNIVALAHRLDLVRLELGNRPISVASWYRDPISNRAVGGASKSQHLTGGAADINISGLTPKQVQNLLDDTWQGGLGYGKTFTHLDIRGYVVRWNY